MKNHINISVESYYNRDTCNMDWYVENINTDEKIFGPFKTENEAYEKMREMPDEVTT